MTEYVSYVAAPVVGPQRQRQVPANSLRGLTALNIVSADVVEVAPPFDHGEITSLAAATVIFDLITLLARRHQSAA